MKNHTFDSNAPPPQDPLSPQAKAMQDGPLAANLVGGGKTEGNETKDRQAGGGYSRFVSWTKFALPFLALALVVLIVVWPRLKPDSSFRLGFSSMQLTGDSQPGMDNARYVGTDENRQPYSITADLARISSTNKDAIDLELPKADLTLDDGTWLVLTAEVGHFTREAAILDLKGNVNLFHDMGYEISTEQLMLNLKTGVAEGKTPLTGHGPFGELKAQGIRLIDKGRLMYFTGPAKLILYTPSGAETK